MADKVKTAFLLAGGCAGCEMSVVDLSEKLVDVLDALEIVFWAPTVADRSGWNCAPATLPRCTIAAKRSPCVQAATQSALTGAA